MCKVCEITKHKLFSQELEYLFCIINVMRFINGCILLIIGFSLAIVYCIDLLEARQSFISIYGV